LINDTFGHAAGDSVLTQVAAILKSKVRLSDVVARYGGDEFISMLVESTRMSFDSHVLHIHLSIGLACFHPEDTDLNLILNRVDRALYEAKREGRNRVAVA